MGIRVTQAFVDVAQPATEKLRAVIGYENYGHAWAMADWYGSGTMVLHMLPPSKAYYQEHLEAYNAFWEALRAADYLAREPKEDSVPVKGKGTVFSMSAVIKNLEHF